MNSHSKNISAQQTRVIRDAQSYPISVQTATASYVDLAGSKVDTINSSSLAYVVKNAHATLTTKWKVMASNDDVSYVEAQAEASVAANGGLASYARQNPEYRYYKIQIIDGTGHGTLEGNAVLKD